MPFLGDIIFFAAPFLAAAFVFGLVFILVRLFFESRKGVSLRSEFKVRPFSNGGLAQKTYTLGGVLFCFLAGYGVTGRFHLALLASLGGLYLGRTAAQQRQKVRSTMLRSQYAQVLNAISSGLQGGLSPQQAIEDAVPGMPEPARTVFAEVLHRTRLGAGIVSAIQDVSRESDWTDLASLAMALNIFERTGCNLVEVLDHLAETVYDRENDRRYVQAVTAQARVTALILSLLPFLLMGAIRVIAPDYMSPLFDTFAGNGVLVFCALMVIAGNSIINRMVAKTTGM